MTLAELLTRLLQDPIFSGQGVASCSTSTTSTTSGGDLFNFPGAGDSSGAGASRGASGGRRRRVSGRRAAWPARPGADASRPRTGLRAHAPLTCCTTGAPSDCVCFSCPGAGGRCKGVPLLRRLGHDAGCGRWRCQPVPGRPLYRGTPRPRPASYLLPLGLNCVLLPDCCFSEAGT